MASVHQVRGALLEEAILSLLRAAGYTTVASPGTDPTLSLVGAGLAVTGRGAKHQIDAIADSRIAHPFSNPQRLLVEAKSYADDRPIGIDVVRNAVGVLKDVSEYWVPGGPGRLPWRRYHYQSAVFSSSRFTADAQTYAFAQDIYLLPLARSGHLSGVLDAIRSAGSAFVGSPALHSLQLGDIRRALRRALDGEQSLPRDYEWLQPIVDSAAAIGLALVGALGGRFPIFLVPARGTDIMTLPAVVQTEIYVPGEGSQEGWSLRQQGDHNSLFTFDLPEELFVLYAEEGVLSTRAALNVKADLLSEFIVIVSVQGVLKVITFRLAEGWLEAMKDRAARA